MMGGFEDGDGRNLQASSIIIFLQKVIICYSCDRNSNPFIHFDLFYFSEATYISILLSLIIA